MKLAIGSDHGGFELKDEVVKFLKTVPNVQVEDHGVAGKDSVDYPDYGRKVSEAVNAGTVYRGILICGTGIGMSIVANRYPKVRAALCHDHFTAQMSREHNDANILVMGERVIGKGVALEIVKTWLNSVCRRQAPTAAEQDRRDREGYSRVKRPFAAEHTDHTEKQRIKGSRPLWLISESSKEGQSMSDLKAVDIDVYNAIKGEEQRELEKIVLIASENYVSNAVLEAQGSVFTNKYAEGYPNRRYYGGCEFADAVESLAIERAKKIFGAEHVNVQPHSGSSANMAVYFSVLKPGDTIVGMGLPHGGHLTHGATVSFSALSTSPSPTAWTRRRNSSIMMRLNASPCSISRR